MRLLPLLIVLAVAFACSDGGPSDSQAALVKRGQQVYSINCTACHSIDPTQAGPVGPPIAGAAPALLEAKVLRNEYPPGYQPKRNTKAMIPLAHLEPELPALVAYLAAAGAQE